MNVYRAVDILNHTSCDDCGVKPTCLFLREHKGETLCDSLSNDLEEEQRKIQREKEKKNEV